MHTSKRDLPPRSFLDRLTSVCFLVFFPICYPYWVISSFLFCKTDFMFDKKAQFQACDTVIEKSGWKSGYGVAKTSKNMAESELNCFSNNLGEKVDNGKDTENFIVNEGWWEVNNGAWELAGVKSQIGTSENANSGPVDFDDVDNRRNTDSVRNMQSFLVFSFNFYFICWVQLSS